MHPARRRKYWLAGNVAALAVMSNARRTVARLEEPRKATRARDSDGESTVVCSSMSSSDAEPDRGDAEEDADARDDKRLGDDDAGEELKGRDGGESLDGDAQKELSTDLCQLSVITAGK